MTTTRTTSLASLLVPLAVGALLLTGCGESEHAPEGDAAETPAATSTPTSTPTEKSADYTEVETFSAPQLRMEEGTLAPLESEEDVAEWLPGDAPADLVAQVDAAAAGVGDGARAYGLVLAVGCDAPEGYSVERVDGEPVLRVQKSLTTTQCLVPTTWLAVGTLPGTD